MTTSPFCPQCGQQVPSLSPGGLCPKCLMAAGLEGDEQPTETHSPGGGGVAAGGFVPPDPALLSKHFPQLEILELLGRGGMGAVYKARQRELDRLVAVKVLPPVLGRDPTFAERFTREARALAKLNHTNIVTIHEVGRAGEFYYFVMEYVDGTNLRDLIQGGACQPRQVLSIIQQMCESLQYAHDHGVVHRDIKPENILIDRQGQVKVADFGLAKLFDQKRPDVSLTGDEQVLGTLRYMAPEQMQGSHDVDHRADIYSLGIVFYELLTGEVPMGRFEPPSKRVQIDVRLDEVVLRTLEREPEKRYQRASDVKTDVVNIVSAPATNGRCVADKCGRLWPWLTWKAFAGYAFVTVFLLLVTIHITFEQQTSWTNAIFLAICVGFLSALAYCWERWPYVPTLPWKNRRNWAPVLAPLVMLYAISYQITGGAPAEADRLTQRIVQFGLLFWTMLFMLAHHHPLQGTFRRWRGRLTRKPEGTHQSTGDVKTDVEHPGWTWPDWAIAAWGLLGVIGMASGLILSPWVSRTTTYALLPIGGIMTSLGALFLFIRGLMRRATREKRADSAAKRNPKK